MVPLVVLSASALLAACGGDDSGEATAAASPAPESPAGPSAPGNSPPTIAGTPTTSVVPGTAFLFEPSASDADGDTLTFAIQGLPSWATFDSATGRLQGTPAAGDIGTYPNIRISVSDGTATANLAPFSIAVVGTATGSATLSWNPPTQRLDGSPLINLAGYKVYWSTKAGSYSQTVEIDNPGVTTYVIDELTPGVWYFVVTAVDSNGVESGYSNTASKTI